VKAKNDFFVHKSIKTGSILYIIPFVEPAFYLGHWVKKGDVFDFEVTYEFSFLINLFIA